MHVAAANHPSSRCVSRWGVGAAGQACGRKEIHTHSGLGVDRAGVSRPLRECARIRNASAAWWYKRDSGFLLLRAFRFDLRVTSFGAAESTSLCCQQTISYYDTSNGADAEDAGSLLVQWLPLASKSGSVATSLPRCAAPYRDLHTCHRRDTHGSGHSNNSSC